MSKHTQSKHISTISIAARLLILILLASILSSCGTVLQTPLLTQPNKASAQPEQAPVNQGVTAVSPTEALTQMPTAETNPAINIFPGDLNFMDGRNVKEMVSSVEIDKNTGLEVALDTEGCIVAYNLRTDNKDLWVVNPLIETGFRWNFGINDDGQVILHNALEEWKYKPFPIEGIKFVKPDELPPTFWDESDPVREDEKYPWPTEGTLAVFDGEGDILMYYSKHENAWWNAGYQSELPGNMVYRQSSMTLALTGIRYKPVDEGVWLTGPELNNRWQEIRNSIDWVAYTRRTGNYISLSHFSSRVSNGEVFEYQSWLYDLATSDYKLITLNNKTKIYVQTQLVERGVGNSYESSFHANYHSLPDAGAAGGILLHPDNSIAIIRRQFASRFQGNEYSYAAYLYSGAAPFDSDTVMWIAASDSAIKEGVKQFSYILSNDERLAWYLRVFAIDPANVPPKIIPDAEHLLSMVTPIIYPNIENLHPHLRP